MKLMRESVDLIIANIIDAVEECYTYDGKYDAVLAVLMDEGLITEVVEED